MILREVFRSWSVHSCHDNVVTLVGLQRHLVDRAEFLLTQDFNLVGVDDFRSHCRVNTGSFDRNDKVTSVLDEDGCVKSEDSCLIGLGHIGEDDIDHRH